MSTGPLTPITIEGQPDIKVCGYFIHVWSEKWEPVFKCDGDIFWIRRCIHCSRVEWACAEVKL